jgi:hypothetical protein
MLEPRASVRRSSSFSGVAARVSARTWQYESSPLAVAAFVSGRRARARAALTFSRAVPSSMRPRAGGAARIAGELPAAQPIELDQQREPALRQDVGLCEARDHRLAERFDGVDVAGFSGIRVGPGFGRTAIFSDVVFPRLWADLGRVASFGTATLRTVRLLRSFPHHPREPIHLPPSSRVTTKTCTKISG